MSGLKGTEKMEIRYEKTKEEERVGMKNRKLEKYRENVIGYKKIKEEAKNGTMKKCNNKELREREG